MINFALLYNKELLYTILCLTTTASVKFDKTTVIRTANIYMSISSQIAPSKNNTFKKLQSVILQSCGLNDTGLTVLSRLGDTLTPQRLRDTRIQLAVQDEENVRAMCKGLSIAMVIDNLDKSVNKVLQHQTLPLLLLRDVPEEYFSLDDSKKTLEEVLNCFTEEYFLLDTPRHSEEKKAFLKVFLNMFSYTLDKMKKKYLKYTELVNFNMFLL